ncbi:MAG: stage V sporulation protein D [Thermoanaerobacteraceae bacterium]|nr:stage V sporulation protein D [Thermoanaerobacteraceae bacterium]
MNTRLVIRKRTTQLFIGFACVLFLLVLRLAWIQFIKGDDLRQMALEARLREIPVEAKRGTIYDRNGNKLAISVSAESVYALPSEVKRAGNPRETARKLAQILGMSEDKVYGIITKDRAFMWVKRKVSFEQAAKIKEADLPGIKTVEESQRFYPKGSLAAHLLGFAGIDNQGLEGLEVMYDKELSGTPGRIVIEYDAGGRQIPQALHKYYPPEDGLSLQLTIDQTIQYIAERELDALMASPTNPKSATIIVMDPNTGYIMALASRPNYDPNSFREYPPENWRNIAVSNAYEPGSTFKIITAATALEEGVVSPEDRFYDPGYVKVGSERIKCWRSYRPHGSQSFVEGVQNSCNPVFVEVGLKVEEKREGLFYQYIKGFGFGQRTGIDLPGEAKGIMIPEDKLKKINVATISIGQSIAVTPIQLITAVSAVANGGKLMKPQLVQAILDQEVRVVKKFEPKVIRKVISEETAKKLALILETVVSQGTGKNAYIEGYRVAGKTGTAQKAGPGGYQKGKYIASFIGFAPANDPKLVVLVVVDEPQGYPYYGGTVAAPIFKRVMEDSLRYLGVPRQYQADKQQEDDREEDIHVPDVTYLSAEKAVRVLKAAGLTPKISGEGSVVVEQMPAAHSNVRRGSQVLLKLGEKGKDALETATVIVPDVTGKRIPEAARLLEALGLLLKPQGSGVAVEQRPIPGTAVEPGTSVYVTFREETSPANAAP